MNRILLVFLVCLPVRAALAVFAKWLGDNHPRGLYILGTIMLVFAIRMLVANLQAKEGDVGLFGGPVWWNTLRLVHAFLFAVFFFMSMAQSRDAWVALAASVTIGAISAIAHYA